MRVEGFGFRVVIGFRGFSLGCSPLFLQSLVLWAVSIRGNISTFGRV